MPKSRHLSKHYREGEESRSKRWQMPPSPARGCTWASGNPPQSFLRERPITWHLVPPPLFFLVAVCLHLSVLGMSSESWQPVVQTRTLAKCFPAALGSRLLRYLPLSAWPWHIHSHMSPRFWRGLAVCPAIGHGVRGRPSTKTSGGVCGGGGGGGSHPPQRLNIPRQNSPDLFIVLCFFLRLMKGRRAKNERKKKTAGDSERREGRGGALVSSVGRPPRVCLWRSLALSERSWGGAVFGWMLSGSAVSACWTCLVPSP